MTLHPLGLGSAFTCNLEIRPYNSGIKLSNQVGSCIQGGTAKISELYGLLSMSLAQRPRLESKGEGLVTWLCCHLPG